MQQGYFFNTLFQKQKAYLNNDVKKKKNETLNLIKNEICKDIITIDKSKIIIMNIIK